MRITLQPRTAALAKEIQARLSLGNPSDAANAVIAIYGDEFLKRLAKPVSQSHNRRQPATPDQSESNTDPLLASLAAALPTDF